ncbi:heat shock 70 kDa protein 12A-like [Mercenaria mercenaria]|uniref:heat shock 70 kDa protein 12A-like n=1 Tax=Mercenaria mercenaria TaxID=6596 RepID=UPI00234F113E|nr:heat shock 70 kDa protein 12A-like [Mercenaria mercenaria]
MITIPAISSDSARQFMREAARDAGIPENQMRLVLEPEAAALYCQQKTVVDDNRLPVGFKYVLADLGGGTSDICVHEVMEDGKLREVYRATGEIAGGTDVDDEFLSFLKELVDEKKKQSLPAKIKESKYADKMEYLPIEARLNIHCDLMKLFFKPSIDSIVNLVNEILKECAGDIDTLLLVGGYSESSYLMDRIKSEFSNMTVVLVEDARLAVLNGAVMMGWKPKNIIQRRSRFTYGFAVNEPFIEGKHPESRKCIVDGQAWCYLLFKKMIEKGQIVEYGQTFRFKGYNTAREPEEKHEERYTLLWRSTRENPQYCIEEGCSMVGEIVKKPPPEGWPDYWRSDTHLIVGETEFTVKDFNHTTGQEYKAQMNFL